MRPACSIRQVAMGGSQVFSSGTIETRAGMCSNQVPLSQRNCNDSAVSQDTRTAFIRSLTLGSLRLQPAQRSPLLVHSSASSDPGADGQSDGVQSPLESHSSYRGSDWSPQRLVFHQNLESFADRVGLIVALQSNGKLSQEAAYSQIRKIWKELKTSKDSLIRADHNSQNT